MARKGFWGTLLNALKGLTGVGGGGGNPPPPSGGTAEPPPPPPPPSSPAGGGGFWDFLEPGNVKYVPQHETMWASPKYGKIYIQTVKGRWTVGSETNPPDISDVRDLVNTSDRPQFTTIIVHGQYFVEYPGQEGHPSTWLSYVFPRGAVDDAINDPELETATDFINELIAPFDEYWEEVYEVQIIDN